MGFVASSISELQIWSVIGPLFQPFSSRLTDPIPEQSRPIRAEGPVFANQQGLPCMSFFSWPSVPDPAHSGPTFGVHEGRITQVPRKTPRRARSISKNDLCVSPPRASTGKARRVHLRPRTPVLPLGPCTSSACTPLFYSGWKRSTAPTTVSSFTTAINTMMIAQVMQDVTEWVPGEPV